MIYNYKKMWGGQHSKYSVLNFIKNTILLNNYLSRSKQGLLRLEQLLRITHKEFWSKKNIVVIVRLKLNVVTLGFKMNRGLPWVLPMLVNSCSGSGSWSAPTYWSSGNCPSGSWTLTSVSTSAAYSLSTCSTRRVHMHMG